MDLHNPWPEVLDFVLRHTDLNQNQLAEAAGISQKTTSRYSTRESRVGPNFDKIAKGAGLTPDQLGYVYAFFQMRHYRPYRFKLGIEEESEIREPASTYDPPTAHERAATLLRLDLREVPADLAPPLMLLRDEIKALLEERESALKNLEERLLRIVEQFEQLFNAARDVKRKMASLARD